MTHIIRTWSEWFTPETNILARSNQVPPAGPQIAPMHSSRCYVCAAEVGGFIYACGGFDGTNRHSSVERYCPVKNQWQMVREMTSVRSDAGACGVDGWYMLFSLTFTL